MRNGASCLMATGTTSGKLINFQENCGATAEFVFKFLPYGDKVCVQATFRHAIDNRLFSPIHSGFIVFHSKRGFQSVHRDCVV